MAASDMVGVCAHDGRSGTSLQSERYSAARKIFLTIRGGAGFAEPAIATRLAALSRLDYSGAQVPGRVEIVTLCNRGFGVMSPQFNAVAEAATHADIIRRKS